MQVIVLLQVRQHHHLVLAMVSWLCTDLIS